MKADAVQSVRDVAMILVLPSDEEVPQKQFPSRFSEVKKRLISVDVHNPQIDVSKTVSFSSSSDSSPHEKVLNWASSFAQDYKVPDVQFHCPS